MLWLIASESKDGTIDMSSEVLAFRLRMSEPDLVSALKPLVSKGFIVDDSIMLAECYQHATPETETETETKKTCALSAALPGLDVVLEKKSSRKEKKKQKLAPYRDDVVAMALAWEDRWPVTRAGKKIRNDVVAVASLVEGILSRDPELDLATLDEAVSEWLKDPGDYPNAMEFWFGPGKNGISPPWERAVRGVLTRRKRLSNGG